MVEYPGIELPIFSYLFFVIIEACCISSKYEHKYNLQMSKAYLLGVPLVTIEITIKILLFIIYFPTIGILKIKNNNIKIGTNNNNLLSSWWNYSTHLDDENRYISTKLLTR